MEKNRRRESLVFVGILCLIITQSRSISPVTIPVGVILDLNSSLGSMILNCTNIALQDLYSTFHNYSTRLQLHVRDSAKDFLTVASAAQDLISNERVEAIIGPEISEQARYVIELGNKYNIPVIWFSPSGPSLLPPRSPFSINFKPSRTSCFQFKAIAAIIEAYNWQCVIPIYEDPEFGKDLNPCLTYALQEMDTRIPYTSPIRQHSSHGYIKKELDKIKDNTTCVFLAHMTLELWSRVVKQVQKVGMMKKGYAWILTQGLSPVIDTKAKYIKEKGDMDGALGVRPYSVVKPLVASLEKRLMDQYNKTPSLYCLWAYDTITSLANMVEKNETILQLEPTKLVIYNIVKGREESIIGYWSPEKGLENHIAVGESAGKYKLRDPTWPGNTREKPKKLKIGVTKAHFPQFADVSVKKKDVSATGLAVDVFKRVVDVLPFPLSYEFVALDTPSSYDDLLCQLLNKKFYVDVMIGDITVVASRTDCVDFTMPYLESSVSMMVKVRSDSRSLWILFKPFHWSLWLILGGIFVGATVVIVILEKQYGGSQQFKDFIRNPFLIYRSGDDDLLKSETSKWVAILITFFVGLMLQVYTANLTSILSERTTAKPSPWKDVQEIKRNNVTVGYQTDSWVKNLLIDQIGLKKHQLKPLASREEYNEKLSKGANKGGVDAIFDETPYLMLLLSICQSCKMTGPIYKTGGFAFALPKNSSIFGSSFTAAILEVTQDVETFQDMKKNISLPVTIDNLNTKVMLRPGV